MGMGEISILLTVIVTASILLSSSLEDSVDAYGRKENKLNEYKLNTQFILFTDGGQW